MPTTSSWCVYCGDFSECQDHVTPVCWNSVNRKMNKTVTVDCCNMCNGLAGDFVAFSVAEKANYLYQRYVNKHRKFNSAPRWTLRQIEELSGYLKEYVKRRNFAHALIHGKLINLDRVRNGFEPIPLRCYDTLEVYNLTRTLVNGDKEQRSRKARRAALLDTL